MFSAFGVEHRDSISKGSPEQGLRMISAYGKKPTVSLKGLGRVGGRKSVVSSRIKDAKKPAANNFTDASSN
jgi:hypothetical protein